MAKYASDDIMDAGLNEVVNNADQLVLCNGQPADYAAATTDVSSGGTALGETPLDSGDFTLAPGDTSGRKITVAAQSGVSIDGVADGVESTWDHVAIVDDTNSRLLLVTTVSSQTVTGGNAADVNAFDEELEDPS